MTADGQALAALAALAFGAAVWAVWQAVARRSGHALSLRAETRFGRAPWPSRPRRAAALQLDRDLLEIAAGLQAGLDFDGAVASLAAKAPWSDYVDQRRAGIASLEAAERCLRPVWPELAALLAVHARYGGPLADMLLLLADGTSRQRLLAAEAQARTSEARASAVLLAVTGPGLGLYMLLREPQLLAPLISEAVGLLALLGAGLLWLVGLIVLRRLLRRLA